jgi:hypothetical protein
MDLSKLVPVVQRFPHRGLPDVVAAVREELAAKQVGSQLKPRARVAIGAGSRGIANLSAIVGATVEHFQDLGLDPFVFPAMGSHGGGTAQGQLDVLAHYGVTESKVRCPVVSSLDVVELGQTPEGIDTYVDRTAFQSDGIFVVNRVKWHTTFDAPLESGPMKMTAIGLGKLQGATDYHRHAVRLGFNPVIRSVARHVIASGKVLGGLALLEDAHHDTAKVVALPADRMEQEEEKLLILVRSWMARILFDEVDVLIVDEVGKHISGVGMDSKVINRHPYGGVNPWPWAPQILRVYIRDLSPLSYGNAIGIGMADVISERAYSKVDWKATRVNAMASSNMPAIRTPLRAETDREALEVLTKVVGRARPRDVTCVWIRNTLELSTVVVTENLLETAPPGVDRGGGSFKWEFDRDGALVSPFEQGVPALVR